MGAYVATAIFVQRVKHGPGWISEAVLQAEFRNSRMNTYAGRLPIGAKWLSSPLSHLRAELPAVQSKKGGQHN
jgi:hypothetical protein